MYKHKNGRFLKPMVYYVATIFADLPIRFINITTFTVIYYWMVGYKATAGAFFSFLLNQYVAGVAYSSQSRLITALSPNQDIAFALNGALIIPSIIYSGLFLGYDQMKPWFIW
jgi:ABC-type multidrug transport system permease subunit